MKIHKYVLAGKEIPEALRGKEISCPLPETYDEATALTVNGDPNRWLKLGNQQFLLNTQRDAKGVAEGEDVAALVTAGNIDGALALVQAAATEYRDGGGRKVGVPSATKAKASAVDGAKAKLAAMDPKQRAKYIETLKALDFDVSLFDA